MRVATDDEELLSLCVTPVHSCPMASVTNGSLADRPLAHLLVYGAQKRLTGTLELENSAPPSSATIVFSAGNVAKIRTSAPVAYLGTVLSELGFLQAAELNESLLEASKQKRPHGQVLLEGRWITRDQLVEGLHEQTLRKLAHLFSFGSNATFAFHDDADLLPSYGGDEPVRTDPSPAIWRGIRERPPQVQVEEALSRIGSAPCRLARGARIERFRFEPDVLNTAEQLRTKAVGIVELRGSHLLPPRTSELLLYCLLLTGELEIVDIEASKRSASMSKLDAMRASVSKMRALTAAAPEGFATPPSSPHLPAVRMSTTAETAEQNPAPPSFSFRVALPVAPRSSSVPSDPTVTAEDLAVSGAKSELEGAKVCLARNDLDRAERLAKVAHRAQPDRAAPLALLAWVAAQKPANLGIEATLARIMMLDKATTLDSNCEEAFWYRAQLHKRVENHTAAMADLRRVTTLNPGNALAVRELRIYEIRVKRDSMSLQALREYSPTTPSGLFDRLKK